MISNHHIRAPLALALVFAAIVAPTATADSGGTLNFKAKFRESFSAPCFVFEVTACGRGEVTGLGRFEEKIRFRGGCDGRCDIRTFTFEDGSRLVLEETATDCAPIHELGHPHGNGQDQPFECKLSDAVNGARSSGRFANATGSLSGTVRVMREFGTIKLAGQIRLA